MSQQSSLMKMKTISELHWKIDDISMMSSLIRLFRTLNDRECEKKKYLQSILLVYRFDQWINQSVCTWYVWRLIMMTFRHHKRDDVTVIINIFNFIDNFSSLSSCCFYYLNSSSRDFIAISSSRLDVNANAEMTKWKELEKTDLLVK